MRQRREKRHSFHKRYIILSVLILVFIGAIWENVMERRERDEGTVPGDFAVLGSYNMHYYKTKTNHQNDNKRGTETGIEPGAETEVKTEEQTEREKGKDTIVFIAGSGTPCAYTDFYYLQNALGDRYQTISYDHAGSGWSTETKCERTVDCLADELLQMLDESVEESSDLILISHSLGSLEAIRFAQKNPERVKAIIFLDGGSPEFYSTDSELSSILLNRVSAVLRVTGIARLAEMIGADLPFYGENVRYLNLPSELQKTDKVMFYHYLGNKENLANIRQINENAKTVMEHGKLAGIPILVLSSDSDEKWQEVQKELADWSDCSSQLTIEGASHYIHWSASEKTVDQITEFLEILQ